MWCANILSMFWIALASFLVGSLADDTADHPAIIRVAVIWHTTSFSSEGSRHSSSFMDGFYFFNEQLKKTQWVAQLGDPQTYELEMLTFNSESNATKITTDIKAWSADGKAENG